MGDFISNYKKYHNLDDEWERNMRAEVAKIKEREKRGISKEEEAERIRKFHGDCEHINTLENGEATVIWLIVAIGALIFNGGWILSIIATVVWFNHITRHWDINGGN